MAKTLELQFVTDLGKTAKLTVDSPTEPIDTAAVKLAMEEIISSGALYSTTGDLVGIHGARVTERNVTEYEII